MSKTIQESIDCLVGDLVRVLCSKVLLSPEMYSGCLDRIADRYSMLGDARLFGPPSGNVFVRGVLAEKCDSLSGTDYALVPKSPPSTITINGVPVEFIPPFQPVVPDEQRPFHHFDTRKLLAAINPRRVWDVGTCDDSRTMEFVVGAMLDPEVRKRVLEARVFDPE